MPKLELLYSRNHEEASKARDRGYEPIECSFGKKSIVGDLCLDHHGEYSDEEPVSLKAAKIALSNHFQPINRFVFAGMPDPDSVYAALVLSKSIRPSLEIGEAIGELDLDPIGIDRRNGQYIRNAAFESYGVPSLDLEGFSKSLKIGQSVYSPDELNTAMFENALAYEEKRIQFAGKSILKHDENILLAVSDMPSRDVWHCKAPLVVQYKPTLKVITLSGCSVNGAKRVNTQSIYDLLGPEGLMPLYPIIDSVVGPESGGRAEIGGSPRGIAITQNQAIEIYEKISREIKSIS